jgi:hypothetical protein
MYADVVEPWLGKYDTLRKIVGRYERGEISSTKGLGISSIGGKVYAEARLRRDHPLSLRSRPEWRTLCKRRRGRGGFPEKADAVRDGR